MTLKLCTKCGQAPVAAGHNSWCRECLNEASRKWNASEAGPRYRRYKLKKTDIYYMWIFQGGRCSVCADRLDINEPKSFHVDHDTSCCPKSKVKSFSSCGSCVRALLCSSCNQGLGNFKDNIQRLKGAIAYLTQMQD